MDGLSYTCSFCDQTFASLEQFCRHIESHVDGGSASNIVLDPLTEKISQSQQSVTTDPLENQEIVTVDGQGNDNPVLEDDLEVVHETTPSNCLSCVSCGKALASHEMFQHVCDKISLPSKSVEQTSVTQSVPPPAKSEEQSTAKGLLGSPVIPEALSAKKAEYVSTVQHGTKITESPVSKQKSPREDISKLKSSGQGYKSVKDISKTQAICTE